VDKPVIKKTIVVYSGRFQPFHKGHYAAYQKLVSKFGANNVYIGTSDKSDGGKSPFNFKEKVVIMGKMFGIAPNKIVQVSNPYAPKEILSKFDGKTTAYIAAVGDKDASRLAGKYFKPYNGKSGYGYDEIGYTYIIPSESNPISGTDVRKWLSSDNAEKLFLKAYPKFDKEIFKMITNKLIKEELIKGYPSKEDVKKIQKKNDDIRSVATTDDSYVYDPIAEQIAKLVFEADSFIDEYFLEEEPNPIMDKEIGYTAADGKKKKITVRGALRLPKDHEAHIQANKLVGPDDAPANEPKGKAATQAAKPAEPGQPVKKDQTAQGKADKEKGGEKPGEQAPPPEQKLSGAELKSSAEMSPEDKQVEKIKQTLDKARKDLSKEDNESIDKVNSPESQERKGAIDVLKKAASYVGHGIKHTLEHNKEMMVGTGRAIKSLATTGKMGSIKDKDGNNVHWDRYTQVGEKDFFGKEQPKMQDVPVYKKDSHGHAIKDKDGNKIQDKNFLGKPKTKKEPVFREDLTPEERQLAEKSWKENERQKDGVKNLAKTTALIMGSIAVTGGLIGGVKAASHGAGVGGILKGAASKIAYKFGGGHLGSYVMKDIIKHSAAEALGANAVQASGVGIALGAAGIFENKNGEESVDTNKFVPNFMEKTLEIMQNYKLSDEQLIQVIANYKREAPKNTAADLMKEDVSVDVDNGDTILMGKFKNKKVQVKDIGKDDHGMPTINGKQATTFRTLSEIQKGFFKGKMKIGGEAVEVEVELVGVDNKNRDFVTKVVGVDKKHQNKLPIGSTLPIPARIFRHGGWVKIKVPSAFNEVGVGDWHFKAIMKMWDKAGAYGRKKIGAAVSANPNANRRQVERDLRDTDYKEITDMSVKLGLLKEEVPATPEKKTKGRIIGEFIKFAKDRLRLIGLPFNIKLVKDGEFATTFKSYGGFDPVNNDIFIYVTNRSTPDILRTLAHELVHLKQRQDGYIGGPEDGATGSDVENEANAAAGILLRDFGKLNGHIYESVINEVKWEDSTYKKCMLGKLPLTLSIVKQLVDPIKTTSLHITDVEHLPQLDAMQGKQKSISTFTKTTKWGNLVQGKGMHTKGGIIVALSGTVLAQSIMDLWTEPDKNGLRWVNPGTVIGGLGREQDVVFNFAPDLKKYKENWKQHSFDGTITNAEKYEFIQKYIAAAYKYMLSKKKEFQNKYLNSNALYYDADWNEVVLNQIKIEKILAIPSNWSDDTIENEKTLKQLKQKYKNVEIANKESDIQNFINNNGGQVIHESITQTKDLIMEGGAYGHMNHPFDISMNLTFGDLKKIVNNALDGKLGVVREKTDGQALAISWKNGRLIAARNKGHLANGGASALDMSALASKFGGRGALSDAYNFAMRDLSAAISGLGEKERQSIFKDGSAFCNLEVIYPQNANVIPYGQSLLVFHNVVEYDEKGNVVGSVKGAESKLASMIKQINAHVQSQYTLQGPPITKLPKDEKLSSQKGKFNGMLSKLQSEFGLGDKDGIAEYHFAWWMKFVNNSKKNLTKLEKEGLARRWAFDNKSFGIKSITDEDAKKWADGVDKDAKDKIMKGNIRKFEDIFLGVGAEVLSFMSSVLTAQPDKALQSIKASLESSISDIKSGGSVAQIKRLEKELARLNAIGGFEKLVPNEGLVFFYKGNTYKLTGTFAPLNQILGIFKFGR
jgi:hypothetical protein